MNATVWTTIVGLVIMAIGSIGFPVYLNRSKNKRSAEENADKRQEATRQENFIDSREVAIMFKSERDRLQTRLDAMQADYERRMHELQSENERALAAAAAKWKEQHDRDQAQIAELRAELQSLYRQLYQQPPHHSP